MTTPAIVAAVDCGTNSIRLLVSEQAPDGSLRDLAREMTIVRLGEGVDSTGMFSSVAIERTREALAGFVETARSLSATAVRMVATSATRDAGNRDDFFDMTRAQLGGLVPGAAAEVISGDTEAELTFAGGVADLDPAHGPFVVTDLGGGSTEIVVGEVDERGEVSVLGGESVDVGCVRLTERVLHDDPPTDAQVREARAVIAEEFERVSGVPLERARRWVGVAGTFTTLGALALDLREYDSALIHGTEVDSARFREINEWLVGMSGRSRAELGPMHPGRADVFAGGSLVAMALADLMSERAGIDRLFVSEKDILDGIAASVFAGAGWHAK